MHGCFDLSALRRPRLPDLQQFVQMQARMFSDGASRCDWMGHSKRNSKRGKDAGDAQLPGVRDCGPLYLVSSKPWALMSDARLSSFSALLQARRHVSFCPR